MKQAKIALEVAKYAHEGQTRRDGITPYIEHPKAVARRVHTDDEKAVAFLHDIIEDTVYTKQNLLDAGIKPHIIEAVEILTKTKTKSYEEYLEDVKKNPLAKTIKIADMLSNLNDDPTKNQIRKYTKGLAYLNEN